MDIGGNGKENLEGEDVVRVSRAEYNHLMQLFHFLSIPHYELLDRQGNVVREELHLYAPEKQFLDELNEIKSRLE